MTTGRRSSGRSWTKSENRYSGAKPTAEEREVLRAIHAARQIAPAYGTGRPVSGADIDRLTAAANIRVHVVPDLSVPAILTPPFGAPGMPKYYRLALQPALPHEVRRYIQLHEVQHVLAGDADEPTIMHFTDPLPVCEPICDLFALVGLIDEVHVEQGPEWVEQEIRDTVPLNDRGWQLYRVADLAPRVIRMRKLVAEWLD